MVGSTVVALWEGKSLMWHWMDDKEKKVLAGNDSFWAGNRHAATGYLSMTWVKRRLLFWKGDLSGCSLVWPEDFNQLLSLIKLPTRPSTTSTKFFIKPYYCPGNDIHRVLCQDKKLSGRGPGKETGVVVVGRKLPDCATVEEIQGSVFCRREETVDGFLVR